MIDPSSSAAPLLPLGELVLRPFRAADAADWFAYLSDPQVTEHTSWPPITLELIAGVVARIQRESVDGTSLRWALSRDADGPLIGTCGFTRWSKPSGVAELAYDLAPSHWGRGYMPAAVEAAVAWAFTAGGFTRVEAFVMDTNVRSARVLERCGFEREQLKVGFRTARGAPRDFWLFGRERVGWAAGRSG